MGRGEEHGQRATFRLADDRGSLAAGGVHHRADIVHACLERRGPGHAIGHAHAALVEADDPRELTQALAEAAIQGQLPRDLEVGVGTLDVDDIDGTVAVDGVGHRDIATLGEPDIGHG